MPDHRRRHVARGPRRRRRLPHQTGVDGLGRCRLAILRNCAAAMARGGRVLVVEMLMPAGNDPSPAKAFDILMLLNQPGGRIRTEAEFRELFAEAGLRLSRVVPTASPNSILEGEPA